MFKTKSIFSCCLKFSFQRWFTENQWYKWCWNIEMLLYWATIRNDHEHQSIFIDMHWPVIWRSMSAHANFINESSCLNRSVCLSYSQWEAENSWLHVLVGQLGHQSIIYLHPITLGYNTEFDYRNWTPRKKDWDTIRCENRRPLCGEKGTYPLTFCGNATCYPCFCD